MTISTGDKLPQVTLVHMGKKGPEEITVADLTAGRKVAIFAVPGAFTPTCSSAHLPSFIRTRDGFAAKGVDAVICMAGNDPFVMAAWAAQTGADKAGITMVSDPTAAFAEGMGLRFDAPKAGLLARSKRYALIAEDGVITQLNIETSSGACEISGGEALLATL
ncbi:MAG: peroxiredoxin [Qingshengfaniella sp.]